MRQKGRKNRTHKWPSFWMIDSSTSQLMASTCVRKTWLLALQGWRGLHQSPPWLHLPYCRSMRQSEWTKVSPLPLSTRGASQAPKIACAVKGRRLSPQTKKNHWSCMHAMKLPPKHTWRSYQTPDLPQIAVCRAVWAPHAWQAVSSQSPSQWTLLFFRARCLSAGLRSWVLLADQRGIEPPPAICQRHISAAIPTEPRGRLINFAMNSMSSRRLLSVLPTVTSPTCNDCTQMLTPNAWNNWLNSGAFSPVSANAQPRSLKYIWTHEVTADLSESFWKRDKVVKVVCHQQLQLFDKNMP